MKLNSRNLSGRKNSRAVSGRYIMKVSLSSDGDSPYASQNKE